jgi:hypothetical protein
MFRVPYDKVALHADKYIVYTAISYGTSLSSHYWKMYLFFLDACGWDDYSYDMETLARIDASWDIISHFINEKIIWN